MLTSLKCQNFDISMMSRIEVRPACGCSFFSFPWAGTEIELSHMGKKNGNPDLVCEKIDYSKDRKTSIRGPSFIRIITFHGDGGGPLLETIKGLPTR